MLAPNIKESAGMYGRRLRGVCMCVYEMYISILLYAVNTYRYIRCAFPTRLFFPAAQTVEGGSLRKGFVARSWLIGEKTRGGVPKTGTTLLFALLPRNEGVKPFIVTGLRQAGRK